MPGKKRAKYLNNKLVPNAFFPLEDRFWEKVNKKSENECWEWLGCLVGSYGTIGYNGKI